MAGRLGDAVACGLALAGEGVSTWRWSGTIRSRLRHEQSPKTEPARVWGRVPVRAAVYRGDPEPAVLADPAAEAARAIVDYRKAWARISGRAS